MFLLDFFVAVFLRFSSFLFAFILSKLFPYTFIYIISRSLVWLYYMSLHSPNFVLSSFYLFSFYRPPLPFCFTARDLSPSISIPTSLSFSNPISIFKIPALSLYCFHFLSLSFPLSCLLYLIFPHITNVLLYFDPPPFIRI